MSLSLGPVSDTLEAEVRNAVRKHRIVVWLDADESYCDFVDNLIQLRNTDQIPYDVKAYRGSHLELLLSIERYATTTSPLVVHLPKFNEESVRKTPLLEFYLAGMRFRKKISTLVEESAAGKVRPEVIQQYIDEPELSLDKSDAWLSGILNDNTGGLAGELQLYQPTALLDDFLGKTSRFEKLADAPDTVWNHFANAVGLSEAWRNDVLPGKPTRSKDFAFVISSWALAVEYVHDLTRKPVSQRLLPLQDLPNKLVETCNELADFLRERHGEFYGRTAIETEGLLVEEFEQGKPEDLGKIDTFKREEERVYDAAIGALADKNWEQTIHWVSLRENDRSFWLRRDHHRRHAWRLIEDAARLGQRIEAATLSMGSPATLDETVEAYTSRGAAVDRAHRQLEQNRIKLLQPQVPEFDRLRSCLDGLRKLWREWADSWCKQFNEVCRQDSFLPSTDLQQRGLFDDVVRPMTREEGTTALFMVDALRYEMAEELAQAIRESDANSQQTTIAVKPRLAELPTITSVGMNVLAPVNNGGTLSPSLRNGNFQGFSTGQFRVKDPDTRKRAMHDRVGGGTCPWLDLDEVLNRDSSSLKKTIGRAELMVVHSRALDGAAEKGSGSALFETVMQRIRSAWHLLREAGVTRFVFTSDHGFLLLDDEGPQPLPHGRKIDPKRRHVVTTVGADDPNVSRVSMSDLGYEIEGDEPLYLKFPDTVSTFDIGKIHLNFVHGGNSLQERVIPVLTVVHRSKVGSSSVRYRVDGQSSEGVAGLHCVKGKVTNSDVGLSFMGISEIELALRAPDNPDVQVDLCDTRGGAKLARGGILAQPGEEFECFFRLHGPTESKVKVELYYPGVRAEVEPCLIDKRFNVTATQAPVSDKAAAAGSGTEEAEANDSANAKPSTETQAPKWLEEISEDPGTRNVFAHIAAHGSITEAEASEMLGGARKLRKFSRKFEELSDLAPFDLRIDVVGGVKRYVREGASE